MAQNIQRMPGRCRQRADGWTLTSSSSSCKAGFREDDGEDGTSKARASLEPRAAGAAASEEGDGVYAASLSYWGACVPNEPKITRCLYELKEICLHIMFYPFCFLFSDSESNFPFLVRHWAQNLLLLCCLNFVHERKLCSVDDLCLT